MKTSSTLPWWTWVLPLPVLLLGTLASVPYIIAPGIYWFYFPINLGIVMTLWWGPRVLPVVYLNALLSAPLLSLPNPLFYPIIAIPEVLEVTFAWFLVRERFKAIPAWQPNPKNISLFFVYGLLIPAVVCSLATQALYVLTGYIDPSYFAWTSMIAVVGDLAGAVFLSLPLIILLSPYLDKRRLSMFHVHQLPKLRLSKVTYKEKLIFGGLLGVMLLTGLTLPLSESWYIYGIIILMSSVWYGLYAALIMNTWAVVTAMVLSPMIDLPGVREPLMLQTPGTLITLAFCSLVTGSAVTSLISKLDTLRETEAKLKIAKDQAESASRAKSDFLACMSHEIRTPLNSVLGMLELLRETQLSKDQERYLTLFSHAGENLKALINDLLDFSKIEAKALSIENVSYNIHSTVRSVFEILQIKAEEKGLNFHLELSKDVPQLQWGDPTRLRQVLFNLIGNALKFTNEGEVLVKVSLDGKSAENILIEVQDTGIGIPREKQGKLFSPFFQADADITRKYGGTGLGLVISKNLVEIMGGQMEMKSLAGRGTTFRLMLPHKPDYSSTIENKQTKAIAWNKISNKGRFRILLVDDSEDNRVLMIHYLKSLPFDCDEAVNGQEAVDKFKDGNYDLVFMDMQMPIMTGYKATEVIRHYEAENSLPHTPIIALTATAVVQDLERTLSSGCDAYAVKPVKKSEVLDILSQSLMTKTQTPPSPRPPPSPEASASI